jgi:hypothetical protein
MEINLIIKMEFGVIFILSIRLIYVENGDKLFWK